MFLTDQTVLKNFLAKSEKGRSCMLRSQRIVSFALLLSYIGCIILTIYLEKGGIFAILGIFGGMAMLAVGINTTVDAFAGKPIPLSMLQSQELVLVKRIGFSSQAFVIIARESNQIRLVEGVPARVEEGETFIPGKDGLVSVAARHVKEEEGSC